MNTLRISRLLPILLVTALSCSRSEPAAGQGQREKEFETMMTGVTLVGHSTRNGRDGLSEEERYRIDKVSHLTGDTWMIHSRLQWGGRDLPLPVPVTIRWAGDTPVLSITDLALPGLGTFTARLLFYRGEYAGTWSGGDRGGQMFGKIVPTAKQQALTEPRPSGRMVR